MTPPDDPVSFKPVAESDFGLLGGWLSAPHMRKWWGEPDAALAEIRQAMAEPATQPFLFVLGDRPVGYIQAYDIHAEAGHPYGDQPPGTIGIDLSIGDPARLGRGDGPKVVEAFVRRLFAAGAPRIVIDPHPANARAIRAYGKAGFRSLGRRTTSQFGPVLLMARDANDRTRDA